MLRKLFWLFVIILCIFTACLCTNYDFDFFDRIIVGEQFIENNLLPYKDFLSYTPTHPWYDHEWGSGVIFYLLLKYFGPVGTIGFYAAMLFGIIFFVTKIQKLQNHAYPTSMIFTVIFAGLFFKLNPTLIRCQLFSFFFFALFLYILEKQRKSDTKLVWLIPLITVFWNNVHGGVVAGLGLIFMYIIGELLSRKNVLKYLYVLLISAPLLVINPYGINYLKFLFSATTMTRKYITEWWPFYSPRHYKYYLLPSLYSIFGWLINIINSFRKKSCDYTKLIVVTIALFEGLCHIKLLSLSLIAVSALCYNDILKFFKRIKPLFKTVEKSLYAVVIIFMFTIPLFSPTIARADSFVFPLLEVEFLKLNNIKGNIVAPFSRAGYVAYKLYPDNLIYMDGRYEEVYSEKEFNTLRDYELGESNWKDIVNNYNTQILMPSKQTAIYKILKTDSEWTHLYDGILCGIFIQNKNIKQSYIEPELDLNYYRKTMFKSTSFGKNLRGNK